MALFSKNKDNNKAPAEDAQAFGKKATSRVVRDAKKNAPSKAQVKREHKEKMGKVAKYVLVAIGCAAMLLSVMHRHAGLQLADQDVFINVVGGIKVEETAADVPLCLALLSSFREKAIDRHTIAFGEIGLTGEVRPVSSGQERIAEAFKQGFTRFIVPRDNAPRHLEPGMEVHPISRINELNALI